MAEHGVFISFEGIDRSGKSTQAALLAEALGERAILVREPGGTVLSERVREILKDPSVPLAPRAEALLFAAARADLVANVVRPALADGKIVIADRFVDSSLAYQGVARGLGVGEIERINEWATDDLLPDRTFLIEIDPQRAAARGVEENDRFEDEGIEFQRKIAGAYEMLADRAPQRIVRVDGDRDVQEVSADVRRLADDLIGATA
ncbi:MAG TPA: dTMP kinase [Solirubrobacterales bacterium]|jgi:dTMP kinase|nr:dTMP kinase [Solirubrobacterales bacterium]